MAHPVIAAPAGPAAELGTAAPWRRTARWAHLSAEPLTSPLHYIGPVEHPVTGEVGFCKNTWHPLGSIAQEWLASQLAREVGVRVPEFRFGTLEGQPGPVGISLVRDARHRNLVTLRAAGRGESEPVLRALREASGLLPFHAWLCVDDMKDEHLVVAEERPDGSLVFAAVDFYLSMQNHPRVAFGPGALLTAPDPELIAATVARIEAYSSTRIAEIVHAIPADVLRWDQRMGRAPDWPPWWISVLQARRGLVRAWMELLPLSRPPVVDLTRAAPSGFRATVAPIDETGPQWATLWGVSAAAGSAPGLTGGE